MYYKDWICLLWTGFRNNQHFGSFTLLSWMVKWLLRHMTTTVTWHQLGGGWGGSRGFRLYSGLVDHWEKQCETAEMFGVLKSGSDKMEPEPSNIHAWKLYTSLHVVGLCIWLLPQSGYCLSANKRPVSMATMQWNIHLKVIEWAIIRWLISHSFTYLHTLLP